MTKRGFAVPENESFIQSELAIPFSCMLGRMVINCQTVCSFSQITCSLLSFLFLLSIFASPTFGTVYYRKRIVLSRSLGMFHSSADLSLALDLSLAKIQWLSLSFV